MEPPLDARARPDDTDLTSADDPISLDWADLGAFEPVLLSNGWTLKDCDGDGPVVCIRGVNDELLGAVELLNFALEDDVAHATNEDELYAAFEDRLAVRIAELQADRSAACPGYTVAAEDLTRAEVDGEPALIYTTVGTDADGTESERHRAAILLKGNQTWLITANSYGEDACMPRGDHELGLERGPRIAIVSVAEAETGSYFAVVPHDGPDARLHVVLGDTIHEIAVQRLVDAAAQDVPAAEGMLLTRLAP